MSNTPETDHRAYISIAVTKDGWRDGPVVVHASFARKLEQQRDILRAELERIKGIYGHRSAPGCGCHDCAQIRPTEDALKAADSFPENVEDYNVARKLEKENRELKSRIASLQYWRDISECDCSSPLPQGGCLRCDLDKILLLGGGTEERAGSSSPSAPGGNSLPNA